MHVTRNKKVNKRCTNLIECCVFIMFGHIKYVQVNVVSRDNSLSNLIQIVFKYCNNRTF